MGVIRYQIWGEFFFFFKATPGVNFKRGVRLVQEEGWEISCDELKQADAAAYKPITFSLL